MEMCSLRGLLKWPDVEGNKSSPFPGAHLLTGLSPKLRSVFMRKAIHHSDEYYQTFVEKLLKKLTLGPPAQQSLPPPMASSLEVKPRSMSLPNIGPLEEVDPHGSFHATPARHSFPTATAQRPGLPPALVPAASLPALPTHAPSGPVASRPSSLPLQHNPSPCSLGTGAEAWCPAPPMPSVSASPSWTELLCLSQQAHIANLQRELFAMQADVQHLRATMQRQQEVPQLLCSKVPHCCCGARGHSTNAHQDALQHAVFMLQSAAQSAALALPHQFSHVALANQPHQQPIAPAAAADVPGWPTASMGNAPLGSAHRNILLPPLHSRRRIQSNGMPGVSEAGSLEGRGDPHHPGTTPSSSSQADALLEGSTFPQQAAACNFASNSVDGDPGGERWVEKQLGVVLSPGAGVRAPGERRSDGELPRWLQGTALPPVKVGLQNKGYGPRGRL
ncbi:hypothetical protein DUNSADRAFT_16575 [Dunaliella salina]|uniref:Uncharacterized protein n=1 Tax=Dunaliella salina TaxID=3046 RepID=A0ABQ7H0V9_DUNSA|nr:hypothetical protein DUNSADRAFT_16575 [Dunaliella salina]|eukprot:KAF5840484.1 hypothetical protein DUNSADRAFT_16575 [Dunaliella salina]